MQSPSWGRRSGPHTTQVRNGWLAVQAWRPASEAAAASAGETASRTSRPSASGMPSARKSGAPVQGVKQRTQEGSCAEEGDLDLEHAVVEVGEQEKEGERGR